MKTPKATHDLMNALLFLETFPDILQEALPEGMLDANEAIQEVLEVYQEKIAVLRKSLREA